MTKFHKFGNGKVVKKNLSKLKNKSQSMVDLILILHLFLKIGER